MSFLFYLKVKKIVLMIFSPILNVIDPKRNPEEGFLFLLFGEEFNVIFCEQKINLFFEKK